MFYCAWKRTQHIKNPGLRLKSIRYYGSKQRVSQPEGSTVFSFKRSLPNRGLRQHIRPVADVCHVRQLARSMLNAFRVSTRVYNISPRTKCAIDGARLRPEDVRPRVLTAIHCRKCSARSLAQHRHELFFPTESQGVSGSRLTWMLLPKGLM